MIIDLGGERPILSRDALAVFLTSLTVTIQTIHALGVGDRSTRDFLDRLEKSLEALIQSESTLTLDDEDALRGVYRLLRGAVLRES